MDECIGVIESCAITTNSIDEAAKVGTLLDGVEGKIKPVIFPAKIRGSPCMETVEAKSKRDIKRLEGSGSSAVSAGA